MSEQSCPSKHEYRSDGRRFCVSRRGENRECCLAATRADRSIIDLFRFDLNT